MNLPFNIKSGIKLLTGIMILGLLPFISSCRGDRPAEAQQSRVLSVQGYLVEPETFSVSIRATGDLMSYEEVELMSPVSGNVMRIHFREGQRIQRGAPLVEIDNRVWKAQKRGLEAQLKSAESELQRKMDLLEIEGVSQEEVEQSEAALSYLQAQIDELNVMIDLAVVRAPFAGQLGMRNFSLGAFLTQGDVITRLVQTDRIKVNFSIPAQYASLATVDHEVQVISSAIGDSATARIYAIEPGINPATHSLQLRALLENPQQKFLPGDFVQIIFVVDQSEKALLIPAEALIPELNTQVVYLARNGHAMRREVATGTRTRDRVHVLEGIQQGDTVLVTGLMELRDGLPIEIQLTGREDGP